MIFDILRVGDPALNITNTSPNELNTNVHIIHVSQQVPLLFCPAEGQLFVLRCILDVQQLKPGITMHFVWRIASSVCLISSVGNLHLLLNKEVKTKKMLVSLPPISVLVVDDNNIEMLL